MKAVLADLERWPPPSPDWEPLRLKVAMILKAAFEQPGSPHPALAAADEQTAFLLERIREGWAEGVPAVRIVAPVLDPEGLLARVHALDACADREHPPALQFRQVLQSRPGQIVDWTVAMLSDGEPGLLSPLQDAGLEPAYALSTLRLSLLGELGDWSGRITAQLDDSGWPRGDCPVCGAVPALAEARGLEQRRFLRCDQCGAGWPSDRLRCPFCGETNHHALRSLFAQEDRDRCRLSLCDGCGGKLKVLTTLAPLSPPGLVLAQFTMLYLDFIDSASTTESTT